MTDTYRGQIRIRKWPRKRGKITNPKLLAINKRFAASRALMKYADPMQVATAMKAAKGTGLYPGDILMHAMLVGMFDIVNPDGTVITQYVPTLEAAVWQGARVQRSSNQALPAGTTTTLIWQVPIMDTALIWNAGSPSRLTVPINTNIVELVFGIRSTTSQTTAFQASIAKNGSVIAQLSTGNNATNPVYAMPSGPVSVIPGDYFEALLFTGTANAAQAVAQTFFSMTLLDVTL